MHAHNAPKLHDNDMQTSAAYHAKRMCTPTSLSIPIWIALAVLHKSGGSSILHRATVVYHSIMSLHALTDAFEVLGQHDMS